MKNHIELVANTYGSVAGRRHDRSASEVQSEQVHRTLGRHLVQGSPVASQQCVGLRGLSAYRHNKKDVHKTKCFRSGRAKVILPHL